LQLSQQLHGSQQTRLWHSRFRKLSLQHESQHESQQLTVHFVSQQVEQQLGLQQVVGQHVGWQHGVGQHLGWQHGVGQQGAGAATVTGTMRHRLTQTFSHTWTGTRLQTVQGTISVTV